MNKEQQKIVPEFRFPKFENDGEWKPTTVEDNCLLKGRIGYRGYTKSDLVEKGKGALVIGGKHIQNNILDISDPTFLTWEKYYESPEIMVEINHIIFSQRGSLGDCSYIDTDIGKATINPSMVLIKDITCNSRFLYYILIGSQIQKEVKRISTLAAIPMLSQKQIKGFPFYIPPPKEQKKIANCLSSLDNLITAETEKLNHLKDHKKGLLQQLFPASGETKPQYRFPEFENDGDWVETTLGEISEITTGTSNRQDSTEEEGEYTFFDRSQDIRTSKRFLFDTEAIIVAGEGQEFKPKYFVGKFDLHQRAYAIMNFKNDCIGKFIFYLIHKNRSYFLRFAVGSTVKSLRLPIFEKMPIYIPLNSKEQQKIADCFSSADDLIEAQIKRIESLKSHKKGLMQQLFPNVNELAI